MRFAAEVNELKKNPCQNRRPLAEKFQLFFQKIGLCSAVLRPRQHSIGYMGDGFYRSKDPTNSDNSQFFVNCVTRYVE